jgi:hypothetical protein
MATFKKFEEIESWKKARELSGLAAETGNMIGGLMNYLRRSGIKGTKYRAPTDRSPSA